MSTEGIEEPSTSPGHTPSAQAGNHTKEQLSFMHLPAELRIQIYRLLIPNTVIPAMVSQKIYREASQIVYDESMFEIKVHSDAIWLCGPYKLPGWKQYGRMVNNLSSAKEYLGLRYNLLARAAKLLVTVKEPWRPAGYDDLLERAKAGAELTAWQDDNREHIEAAANTKINVHMVASCLREIAYLRKQQALPKLQLSIVAFRSGLIRHGCSFDAGPQMRWYFEPLTTVRATRLIRVLVNHDILRAAPGGEWETFRTWEKDLRKRIAGNRAPSKSDLEKRRMQGQLDRVLKFKNALGLQGEYPKEIRRSFLYARLAFAEGERERETFENRVRDLVTGWDSELRRRKEQQARAAASFAVVAGEFGVQGLSSKRCRRHSA